MKETRTINLNGLVFHIDNDAFQALNSYLQDIELRLPADEREDVMTDIEARVCELLQSALFAKNVQVVDLQMIENIKERIGAPSEFGENKRPKVKGSTKTERSGCGRVLKISLIVLLGIIGGQFITPILFSILAVSANIIGIKESMPWDAVSILWATTFDGFFWGTLFMYLCILVAFCLPIYAIIHTIISLIRSHRLPGTRFWLITILCWFASLFLFGATLSWQMKTRPELKMIDKIVNKNRVDAFPDSTAVDIDYFDAEEDEDDYNED